MDFVRSFGERSDKRVSLHVDQLADPPRGPHEWVASATKAFVESVNARDRLRAPVTVAVEIFLAPRSKPTGIIFRSFEELTSQLSWTPPEIVLYRSDATPNWQGQFFRDVTGSISDRPAAPSRVLLQEWRSQDEHGQIDRRVWLVSSSPGA